jgi:hypothetical protein
VLVDFTADWCLTCQANKKTSLEIPSVEKKLKEINAASFLGDYTREDPLIEEELKRYARAGVPLGAGVSPGRHQASHCPPGIIDPLDRTRGAGPGGPVKKRRRRSSNSTRRRCRIHAPPLNNNLIHTMKKTFLTLSALLATAALAFADAESARLRLIFPSRTLPESNTSSAITRARSLFWNPSTRNAPS